MSLQRQVMAKMHGKRDPEQEKEALDWIFTVLGEPRPEGDIGDILRDGQVLCRLMNKLAPGSVPKINTSGSQFKLMENINNFSQAMRKYGVSIVDLFQTSDLFEKKDLAVVTNSLFSLGRTTYQHPEWPGPWLGPRPAEEHHPEFSEEAIIAGKATIGLQAGSNKGATQAGDNTGAARRVILGK
ncbi:muscle-specific protein 20-like isoform X1 [Penaeus chinensis]|uniref:muscle-specific protein 20-like isoform X1 n=1 Tax=Penaeus chinensis TaxID=139456 RepID=UPI001FB79D1C|nr:muscle-specific protein 20-like isoform X1 [Penaeus chinensis]